MIEVSEHIKGAHGRVGDDFLHVRLENAGKPFEGRHPELGMNPVQCGRFFDEGKLVEQRADFLLRPKSLLGHVFVGSPVNFLVV